MKALVSDRVVTPNGVRPAAVLVEGERIVDVVAKPKVPAGAEVEDFGEAAILPGLVDSHVHINDPGRAHWEGFFTATRAAAAGGYTMLVDMPLNCIPATTTEEALEAKRKAAEAKCRVDWAAWGGLVPGNDYELERLARAGVRGFKCFLVPSGVEEFSMVSENSLREALPALARTGLPLLVHAELPGPIDAVTGRLGNADWTRYETYLYSRPEQAELAAIRVMLALCREFRFHLHIVHLSAASALPLLKAARAEGLPVTVETCPHYLHLRAEEIGNGATTFKCAPPIRTGENRERLWQGLKEGIIDFVVTDHSPCPPEMKRMEEGNFAAAWGGIPGLSLALSIVWSEASARGLGLSDVARWMSTGPAQLAGCQQRKGSIAAGYDADFAIFDPDADFCVTPERLHHRHPISPYVGESLRGRVRRTYLRGNMVFDEGQFPGDPVGHEFRTDARS